RAAGASDHNGLALDHLAQQFWIGRHRGTAQQLVDVNFADLAYEIFAAHQFADGRDGPDFYALAAERGDDLLAPGRRQRGDGNDNLVQAVLFHQFRNLGRRKNTYAGAIPAMQGAAVIEKGNHAVIALGAQ